VIATVALGACASGDANETASTTTTSSPAPEWLRREVSQLSRISDGPAHGTGWVKEFATRSEALAAVDQDHVQNVAEPSVYLVVLRGGFVSKRGFPDASPPRGEQLTLVIPQEPGQAVLDTGITPETPPPAGSERFGF
jgi:hypothetical protein